MQDRFVLYGTNLYIGNCLDSSFTVSYMRNFFCCQWATEWSPVWDHKEVDWLRSLQPNSGTGHFSNSSNPFGEFEKWLHPLNKYRGVYIDILPWWEKIAHAHKYFVGDLWPMPTAKIMAMLSDRFPRKIQTYRARGEVEGALWKCHNEANIGGE